MCWRSRPAVITRGRERAEPPPSAAALAETARVKECFWAHGRRYGVRRIAASLGLGRHRVRRIMREEGLQAIAPKRFVPRTTDSKHQARVSPCILTVRQLSHYLGRWCVVWER